jgi:hypothetical protein
MIVCGNFKEDLLTFTPVLTVEISSGKITSRNSDTKYRLWELQGVRYC